MALLDRKSVLGASLTAAATASLAAAPSYAQQQPQLQQASASAQFEQCAPLYRNQSGQTANARLSAHIYSQENIGAVGISIFPGQDLTMDGAHSAGTALASAFKRNGIEARCFVHSERGPNGSGFGYKIAGQSWNTDGPLNIVEASDVETLRGVAAEARTARALLASGPNSDPSAIALNR